MNRAAIFALVLIGLPAACVTGPGASDDKLQDAVSFMVAIGQHGEGADIAETLARLDSEIATSPRDPYVLKTAAMTRASLADDASDPALRRKLREDAIAQLDRAAAMAGPSAPAREAVLNGLPYEVDFSDVAELKQQLTQANAADR
jgi:hypothetical protein